MTGSLLVTEDPGGAARVRVPAAQSGDLAATLDWLTAVAPELHELLPRVGAVLVSGAPIRSAAHVARARDALFATPTGPGEYFGARQDLGNGVYAAAKWPADRILCPHNEESYSLTFPRLVLAACLKPPGSGGEILLSDGRRLLGELPAELLDRFRTHGWMMSRTFRPKVGLPWQEVFGVTDPQALADRCREQGIDLEWRSDAELRTRRRRSAVVRHPVSGQECWFNQASFFSQWSLDPEEREVLLAAFGQDGLPLNTYLGDGTALTEAEVNAIIDAHDVVAVPVPWQAGDLLLLDNITMARGRRAYTGTQMIVTSLGEPVTLTERALHG